MNIVWTQTATDRWVAEGAQGWRGHVAKGELGFSAWIEREPTDPFDDDFAEISSDWYYTLEGAQAWCLDRLIGRSRS